MASSSLSAILINPILDCIASCGKSRIPSSVIGASAKALMACPTNSRAFSIAAILSIFLSHFLVFICTTWYSLIIFRNCGKVKGFRREFRKVSPSQTAQRERTASQRVRGPLQWHRQRWRDCNLITRPTLCKYLHTCNGIGSVGGIVTLLGCFQRSRQVQSSDT